VIVADRLFKFLGDGSVGRFSGFAWPAPGEWVSVDGQLDPCVSGIHVCRTSDLPYWLDDELWEVEVAGERLVHLEQLVVRRARLTSRIKGWVDTISPAITSGCLHELRRLAARELELSDDPDAGELAGGGDDLLAAQVARDLADRDHAARTGAAARLLVFLADAGDIAADSSLAPAVASRYVAYIAAHAADEATPESRLPPGSTGFSEERRRQADQLARALDG
jgi:hypothetical protein